MGEPNRRVKRNYNVGCNHPQWKGGRLLDKTGYVLIYCPDHPYARGGRKRYVREHRLVMEKHLKRYLTPQEVVHHKNGIKTDNSIDNLMIFPRNSDHLKKELTGKVPHWSVEGKKRCLCGLQSGHKRWVENGRPGLITADLKKNALIYYYQTCGYSVQAVAYILNFEKTTVARYLKRFHIPLDKRLAYSRLTLHGVQKLKQNPKVLKLYASHYKLTPLLAQALLDIASPTLSQKDYSLWLSQVFPRSTHTQKMTQQYP